MGLGAPALSSWRADCDAGTRRNIADGYCHVLPAVLEPKDDAWKAFRKTLENLHYPLFGEAITYRSNVTN